MPQRLQKLHIYILQYAMFQNRVISLLLVRNKYSVCIEIFCIVVDRNT